MMALFDGRQVGKDVGVVELQIVQHQRHAVVVDELGRCQKGRVVFVSFDDEERDVAETRQNAKVFGTPPMRNPGAGLFEYQASMALVVVLPCVPATPSTQRPRRTFSANHCGPDT